MKAFVGRSFDKKDEQVITKVTDFIKSLDIECVDAKPAKPKTVEEKITELIKGCDIFVGIFNCDRIICQEAKKVKLYCKPKNKTTIYTTSNWVIQESGFALGSNKYLILLKEDGVCELPELQGNLEYIPFDRNHLEESFLKISQMISDIKTKASGGVTEKSTEGLSKPEEPKSEEHKEPKKEEIKDEKERVLNKVNEALWGEKDYSKAQKIFDEEVEASLDEDDRIPLRAFILRVSHSLGDKSAFDKLEKLALENQDKPRVIKQLAYRYKTIGEFKKAKEQFLLAAEKYDINNADKRGGLIEAYIQAAWCLAYEDDLNAAIELIRKLLSNSNFHEYYAEIFEAMARISKNKGDIENFLVYAEAALDSEPVNAQLRFDIAYAYSGNNNEKLALLHYKKLTDTTKHGAGLNNMGVSYERLELKGKSIRSYLKASEEKQTISMGNLAHAYVDAGFVDDAQNQIDKANKLSNEGIQVNPRVGDAQHKITTLLAEENKKEEGILLETRKESQYRIKYSNALCSDAKIAKSQIEGTWQTSWGNLRLDFDEKSNNFQINEQIKVEDPLLSAILSSKTGEGAKYYKDRLININGQINNLSGRYKIQVSEKKGTTLATEDTNIYEADGYLVINEDCDYIETMEKTKDGKTKFEQWRKNK
jgi:tetratricopeptide (TPR) repeat protein